MSNTEISRAQRLDQYVTKQLPELSRAFASKLIESGKVLVNGSTEVKPGYKMRSGDSVTILYDSHHHATVPTIDLPILYEDDDCLVINKPAGLLTHSKGAFNPEATIASFVRQHSAAVGGDRAGIVHRLDRATSGVIIAAKNPEALSWLQKQFSQRRVKKTYQAIVWGHPANDEAVIDMPIERNPKLPATFRVGPNGRAATTHYRILKSGRHFSMLELAPETGRTHQLRVHLSHLGHSIAGDTLYGGKPADRLLLHACRLEITLPNRERKLFEAPVPADFAKFMAADV